jgi:carboxylate-amine ligase
MTIEFLPSPGFSVGMEMEYQLLDAHSLDLTDGILPLLEIYPNSQVIKPEFIQNTVEVASSPCADACALNADLRSICPELIDRAEQLSMALSGGATHPFSQALAVITPMPRYLQMQETYGYQARSQITFATHVHVGVPSGDEAIHLMREMKTMLPVLIALSANSPFWRGFETGFASYRHIILAASRSYGQPPDFDNWLSFTDFFERSKAAGVYETVNSIHWDLRPRPRFGTLEVRVMDAQTTVTEACALAVLVRAMVRYLRRTRTAPEARILQSVPWWVHKDNCYLAARDALEAKIISSPDGSWLWLRDVVDQLLADLSADVLDAERALIAPLIQNLERETLGFQQQEAIVRAGGSWRDVVADSWARLQADIASGDPQSTASPLVSNNKDLGH